MSTELSHATDLTFNGLCKLLKKQEPELLEAVDSLLGLALICSPVVLGEVATPALGLLGAKNELTKIGKKVFEKVVARQEDDLLAHHQRMLMGYTLISFTSFFEALDRSLPKRVRDQIALQPNEKAFVSREAAESSGVDLVPIAVPHPAEDPDERRNRLRKLYEQMENGFLEFVSKLACWETFQEAESAAVKKALSEVPALALKLFDAQFFALSRKFPDFAMWANLHRHEHTQKQVASLGKFMKEVVDLSRSSGTAIDVGFSKLHDTILSIPTLLQAERAAAIVNNLRLKYEARLNDPIIEDKYESVAGRPQLAFPKVGEAFIPQSYRVLRHAGGAVQLESEDTWKKIDARRDLGAFPGPRSRSGRAIQGVGGADRMVGGRSPLMQFLSVRCSRKSRTVRALLARRSWRPASLVHAACGVRSRRPSTSGSHRSNVWRSLRVGRVAGRTMYRSD